MSNLGENISRLSYYDFEHFPHGGFDGEFRPDSLLLI